MKIENPLAFSFVMQDEIYLLAKDKMSYPAKAEPKSIPVPVSGTPAATFNYLGENKKQFLVMAHYPGLEFMAAEHQAALESTLKRLGLGLPDVAIVNRATYPEITFEQLLDSFTPQTLLIFGHSALPGGIEAPEFNKPVNLGECNTLFTHSFNDLMESNENKKAFWEQMKQL